MSISSSRTTKTAVEVTFFYYFPKTPFIVYDEAVKQNVF